MTLQYPVTSQSYLHVDPAHENGVGCHSALRQNVAIWQFGWDLVAEFRLVVILKTHWIHLFRANKENLAGTFHQTMALDALATGSVHLMDAVITKTKNMPWYVNWWQRLGVKSILKAATVFDSSLLFHLHRQVSSKMVLLYVGITLMSAEKRSWFVKGEKVAYRLKLIKAIRHPL